jgi:hypothetical protein
MKEDCRDARATRWAHDLVQDVRFAARLLTKDRGSPASPSWRSAPGLVGNTRSG